MSENIIKDISAIEEIDIGEESLPEAVSAQFLAISEIDLRIQEAEKNCATAKEIADKMILAKTLNQKDAINTTQDAVRSIAEAQEKLSNAQKTFFPLVCNSKGDFFGVRAISHNVESNKAFTVVEVKTVFINKCNFV